MDPVTVILILGLHLCSSGALMLLVGRSMPGSGLGHWGSGGLLFGGAYIGRLALGANGESPAVLLLDLAMVSAALLFTRGLRAFFRRTTVQVEWYVAIIAGYALLHLWAVAWLGAQGRHVLLNGTLGVAYAVLSVAAWVESRRQVARLRLPLRVLGALMGGQALLTLGRAGRIVLVGTEQLFTGLHAQVYYGFSSVTALLLALTLLWMVFERLHERLAEQATHDALTGLLNRNGLRDALTSHFARRDAPALVLMLVDIDQFKAINDRHGHALGDAVLVAVAARLAGVLRDGDFVARIGGEEFLIGCSPSDDAVAAQIAQRLTDAVAHPPMRASDGSQLPCTVSIGVSAPITRMVDWEFAMHQADAAMYTAKNSGRNRIRVVA